jgi:c-di-GMP-binding flagellar brake protein YcgR
LTLRPLPFHRAQPSEDERQYPRVLPLASRPVEVQIMGESFLEVLTAEDISIGGVGVRVPHGFNLGDFDQRVQLIIALPGHKPFKAEAVIRHRDGSSAGRFGVQFTSVANLSAIQQYVNELLALGRRA